MSWKFVFPFSATVGQDKVKLALLLNVINPRLGGVLLRGEKGTAKSSIARSLSRLLPLIQVVEDCPFNCDPLAPQHLCSGCQGHLARGRPLRVISRPVNFVDLPVSATEERVVGTLNFEAAIRHGQRHFEPGLLARAHRGILYIDEINLLDDHLVDIILDVAASGENVVEREGLSFRHASEFVLIGSMNPEEGELRPQLLDRFGLSVRVEGLSDPGLRVEVMRRKEAFDADPIAFCRTWEEAEGQIRDRIISARRLLPQVDMSLHLRQLATTLCLKANTAGLRGDILLEATARTIAAWENRREVKADDVYLAAEFVLAHRARIAPPPPEVHPPEDEKREDSHLPDSAEQDRETGHDPASGHEQDRETGHDPASGHEQDRQGLTPDGSGRAFLKEDETRFPEQLPEGQKRHADSIFPPGEAFPVRRIYARKDRLLRRGFGRRSRARTPHKRGRYIRATTQRKNGDLALDATLRAAAPHQRYRNTNGLALAIRDEDIREKVREKRVGNLLLFVVDASGSMGAEKRMTESKGVILSLLLDAYQKRDRVGLVAFRGTKADVLLPPTNSVERAQKLLQQLPTGGRTPLAAGLLKAYDVISQYLKKDRGITPILILISDGKANVAWSKSPPYQEVMNIASRLAEDSRVNYMVIDVEKNGFLSFGLAEEIARQLRAVYFKLEDLRAEDLLASVKAGQRLLQAKKI